MTNNSSVSGSGLDFRPAFAWLKAGWSDLWIFPGPSLLYGLLVFCLSWVVIASLFAFDLNAHLFPALAGFLIIGPFLAMGLYDKSRSIEQGHSVRPNLFVFVRAKSAIQLLLAGVLLCLLILLWMRTAVILYALFFGLQPFSGIDQILPVLLGTPYGLALVAVGTAVGGLFAAFAFAISVIAVPLLFDRQTDALTAMALSLNTVWRKLDVMLPWGVVVVMLVTLCLALGLLPMVIVFPLLGHATWHLYRATFDPKRLV